MSVCSSACVPTCIYFASICKAWKSETQGGLLRKFTKMCRNKTHTHTDSSFTLRAVCISVCLSGWCSNNREAWGSGRYPRAHHLTLDRWTRVLFFPLLPAFMGPLIMLTYHIKIKLSMQFLWYWEEVSWSDAIKCLSAELAFNFAAQVWTWRGKGKGAAAPTVAYWLSDALCPWMCPITANLHHWYAWVLEYLIKYEHPSCMMLCER